MSAPTRKELAKLSDIIHTAYSDISSPGAWSHILSLTQQVIPLDCATVIFYDTQTGRPDRCVSLSPSPNLFRSLQGLCADRQPLLPRALARGMYVWRPTDIVHRHVWENTEMYREFLYPNGFRHFVTGILSHDSPVTTRLYLIRSEGERNFTRRDVQLLGLAVPHIRNAIRVSQVLREVTDVSSAFRAGLDQFGRPVFIFDDQVRLLFMNRPARIVCESPASSTDVLAEIRSKAYQVIHSGAHEIGAQCTRQSLKCVLGGRTYMIEGFPVQPPNSARQWVFIATDLAGHLNTTLKLTMEDMGLSSLESKVCTMLIAGWSDSEIAERLAISEQAVKNQVADILDKLDVSNRHEVARKLIKP